MVVVVEGGIRYLEPQLYFQFVFQYKGFYTKTLTLRARARRKFLVCFLIFSCRFLIRKSGRTIPLILD